MEQRPFTTGEIAEYCHVTHRAVLKWISQGKLKAYRTPGKHSRVSKEDFLGFLKEYDMPIPETFQIAEVEKKRILIVDDDRGIVKTIRRALELGNKYEIEEAFDGFSAGKKFYEFRPDLMTLDIRMPRLDGFEVCAQIRSDPRNNPVRILVVSGFIGEKEINQVISLGANDYLAKPFANKVLIEKIEHLLDSERAQVVH